MKLNTMTVTQSHVHTHKLIKKALLANGTKISNSSRMFLWKVQPPNIVLNLRIIKASL